MALSSTQQLIALDLIHERDRVQHLQRARAALLGEFLAQEEDAQQFVEPLRAHGVDLGKTWRAIFFQWQPRRMPPAPRARSDVCLFKMDMAATIDARLAHAAVPSISGVAGDVAASVAVFEDGSRDRVRNILAELTDFLQRECPDRGVVVGVSAARLGPFCPAAPFRQAIESVRSIDEGVEGTGPVLLFDEAGARFRLLDGQSLEALTSMCDRFIDPLIDHDVCTTPLSCRPCVRTWRVTWPGARDGRSPLHPPEHTAQAPSPNRGASRCTPRRHGRHRRDLRCAASVRPYQDPTLEGGLAEVTRAQCACDLLPRSGKVPVNTSQAVRFLQSLQ